MKLFELRAYWEEYYDCPDNGETKICDTYETVAFAINDDTKLKEIASELAAGFKGRYWSEKRSKELRRLYSGFNDHRHTEYKIIDVSNMIL